MEQSLRLSIISKENLNFEDFQFIFGEYLVRLMNEKLIFGLEFFSPWVKKAAVSNTLSLDKHILFLDFRLDFDNFVLSQPEGTDHVCQADQFVVSGGAPISSICGTNTGQHSEFNTTFFKYHKLLEKLTDEIIAFVFDLTWGYYWYVFYTQHFFIHDRTALSKKCLMGGESKTRTIF